MEVHGLSDNKTNRVVSLTILAKSYVDEAFLTAINVACQKGRVTVETSSGTVTWAFNKGEADECV